LGDSPCWDSPPKTLGKCLLVLAVILGTTSCRPELIVRLSSLVYHDGSLDRSVEIVGRTPEGATPTDDAWMVEEAGLRLADPTAWDRVEEAPGRVRAEGFFGSVDELPPTISFKTGETARRARIRTKLDIDERVVLRRWSYVEMHGDPYSASDSAAAIDALTALVVEALRSELNVHFGGRVDTGPAEDFMWNRARALAKAALSVTRSSAGWENGASRRERWTQVLGQYGTTPAMPDDDESFWEFQLPMLLDWGRGEVAAAISTPEEPIGVEELNFWPTGEDHEEQLTEIAKRVWGSEDRLFELVEPHLDALSGYYAGDMVPRFLFEVRVRLPGVLLKTNGTPDGDSVVWIFRERDLSFRDLAMRVESIELQEEPLVALGARRKFDRARLVQLADLLWKRDKDGQLVEALERAVKEGSLETLRDEDEIPDEIEAEARELADLLSPQDLRRSSARRSDSSRSSSTWPWSV